MWKNIYHALVKNWLPTLGGLVTAAAPIALSLGHPDIAALFGVLGPILLGGSAKQSNVTGTAMTPTAPALAPATTSGGAPNAND